MSDCLFLVRVSTFILRWQSLYPSLSHPSLTSSMGTHQHNALSVVMEELMCSWSSLFLSSALCWASEGMTGCGVKSSSFSTVSQKIVLPSPPEITDLRRLSFCETYTNLPLHMAVKKCRCNTVGLKLFQNKAWKNRALEVKYWGPLRVQNSWGNLTKFWNAVMGHYTLLNCIIFSQHSSVLLY